MEIVVEYAVILPKSSSVCDSVAGFNRFLEVDSSIHVKGNHIHHNNFQCGYHIGTGEISGKDQRYFQLKFKINPDESVVSEAVEALTLLLKAVRGLVMGMAKGQLEVLWDDIALYYSKQAYTKIYEIENLMRKLIANFLLITVGKEWATEATPQEVKEAANKQRQERASILYSIDFIDLTRFLLRPYSKSTDQDIYAKLKKANTIEELEEIKAIVPQSNWERYFSRLVACEDGWLNTRWNKLYDYRCMIAHNSGFTKSDLEQCDLLIGEVKPKLEEALSKLPQVSVAEDERDLVAEDAAANSSFLLGRFVDNWKELHTELLLLASKKGLSLSKEPHAMTVRTLVDMLVIDGSIPRSLAEKISELNKLRNILIHDPSSRVTSEELGYKIKLIAWVVHNLKLIHSPFIISDAISG